MGLNFKQMLCKLNPFYNYGTIKPTKMVLHSTGCNNPNLSRWTNSWNSKTARNSVHGVIGKDKDGNVEFVQLLPFTKKAAGVGKGSKGSYNSCAIQVEIAEDDLKDKEYFTDCYNKAVEVFAEICKEYKIDSDDIVCHCEAHKLGYGSNHADVMHWFPKYGKDMDDFRKDVKKAMEKTNPYKKPTRELKKGDKGEDVKWLQYELNKNGANLKVDGEFGSKTYAAVVAYQKPHTELKIKRLGTVGTKTIKSLAA